MLLEVTLLRVIEARNASSVDAVLKQLVQLRGETGAAAPAPAAAKPAPVTPVQHNPAPVPAVKPVVAPVAPAADPEPAMQLSEAPAPAPVSGSLEELWKALVESVGRASPFTRSYLIEAQPVSFERGLLVIGFDPEFEDYRGLVDNARNHALIQTKLAELGHPNSQIKFIRQESSVARPPKAEPAAPLPATPPATPPPAVPAAAAPKPSAPAAAPKVEKIAPPPFNKEEFKNDPLIKKALEIFKGQIIEARA